jgi:peptidoglycan/LPS O-acetylase OafA/YrhL
MVLVRHSATRAAGLCHRPHMEYRPELDGVRAVAVLAVVAFHSYLQLGQGGWLGVDVFFVLSGYLITAILLSEQARSGTVQLRRFYVRRLLRLYPALVVTLAIGAVFFTVLGDGGTGVGYLRTAGAAGTYIENLVFGFGSGELGRFGHTWSLAVEMQFYLLWPPLVVWLLARKADLLPWVLSGIVISYVLLVVESGPRDLQLPLGYYMPWTRAFELLIGALIAVRATRSSTPTNSWLAKRWVGWSIVGALGVVFLLAATYSILLVNYVLAWEAPLAAILTALLITHLNAVGATGVGAVLAWKPLASIGKISYGIYLVHYPALWVLRDHGLSTKHASLGFLLVTTISIVIATASYRFVELPALNLKRKFEPAAAQPIV